MIEFDAEMAPVLDLAAFRASREAAAGAAADDGRCHFEVLPDGRLEITIGDDVYEGSAEDIGRYITRAANHYRRQAERKEATEVHLPAIRAAMNDAIVALRAGGQDAAAEKRAEDLRNHGWTWQMLEQRERDRWLRHMRKRSPWRRPAAAPGGTP